MNGQTVSSGGSVEIPPRSYTVVFLPVAGRKTPNNLSGTITAGGEVMREGKYFWVEELYLEDQSDNTIWALLQALSGPALLSLAEGTKTVSLGTSGLTIYDSDTGNTLSITPDGISLYDSAGDGIYMGVDGWIQQKKEGKEV